MSEMLVTEIYDEIITYYRDLNYKALIFDALDDQDAITINGETRLLSPPDEAEALFFQDEAYYIFESEDQKETRLETLRSYLSAHFLYLLKDVFYLEMKKFKKRRTYFVSETDYPIIKEILLRSISQKEQDLIIGKWLNGQVADNSYYELSELSERLYEIISHLTNTPCEVKERWMTALRLALRTELANAIIESEFMIKQIFSYTLPFRVEHQEVPLDAAAAVCQTDVYRSLQKQFDMHGQKTQSELYQVIYHYLENVDFEKLLKYDTVPPVELMQMKCVCELLVEYESFINALPYADKITKLINHFISVDKGTQAKKTQRIDYDKKRYQKNKNK